MNELTPKFDETGHQRFEEPSDVNIEFIVTVKTTYQTSEDTWERATLTRSANQSTTIGEIFKWAKSKNADLNTIRIHNNEIN